MKRSGVFVRVVHAALIGFAVLALGATEARASSTYYVSPGGNDGNDGLSPGTAWQTVGKVNSSSFQAGDSILFQRGGQWHESLVAPSSGDPGNPITFADFGDGAKPKFWGSVVLDNSQFQAQGGGIYTYAYGAPVYSVLVDHGFFNYAFGQWAGNFAHAWSYGGGQIAINSPDSDPRYDGRVYTAVLRDDVVYSNYRNHLVFRNLVADESARYDDNGGYAFRVMGSQDVLLTDCEAYHAGKHHFGVINSTQFVGTNLTAAYAAPGQASTGGASAYVSYGDASTGLYSQTSEWHNIVASNLDDPQDGQIYDAFLNHGATLSYLLLDHLQSFGAHVLLTNAENPSATVKITGGLIQNARLEVGGSGAVVDGMEISGPQATVDLTGDNITLQNMLIHGTNLGSAWYRTAVLSRGNNNTLRFSTIDMDPAAGTNTCVATINATGQLQMYADALLAPVRVFALWDFGASLATISQSNYNFFNAGTTFAWWVGGAFQWSDIPLAQWQADGFDLTSQQGIPRLVNEAGGDYHPGAGSPLIDAAKLPTSLLAAVPTDFGGGSRLQGAAFDIGAYEGTVTGAAPAVTTTSLSLNNNILTAVVTAASGSPAGTVNFLDGTTLLNTVPLVNGSASTGVSLSTTEAHSLTAAYSGDANDQPSTSAAINVDPVTPPAAPAPPVVPPAAPVAPVVPGTGYPIALTFPVDGQSVSGVIVVLAAIGQTLDAAGSHLLLDGQTVDGTRVTNGPFVYRLDTSSLTAGPHQLQVWAHDTGNNTLLSNPVTINVTP